MVYINNCFFLNQLCDNMHKAWSKLIFCGHQMESWVLNKVAGLVFLQKEKA